MTDKGVPRASIRTGTPATDPISGEPKTKARKPRESFAGELTESEKKQMELARACNEATAICPKCGGAVVWAKDAISAKRIPLDIAPTVTGDHRLYLGPYGLVTACRPPGGYTRHLDTCSQREAPQRVEHEPSTSSVRFYAPDEQLPTFAPNTEVPTCHFVTCGHGCFLGTIVAPPDATATLEYHELLQRVSACDKHGKDAA